MKTYSNIKPSTLTKKEKDGSYMYNYDITSETITDEEGNEEVTYSYQMVRTHAPLRRNTILKDVIKDAYDQSYELKLVNEYNSAVNGLYDDDADTKQAKIDAYTAFLTERARLKAIVDSDCDTLGIE